MVKKLVRRRSRPKLRVQWGLSPPELEGIRLRPLVACLPLWGPPRQQRPRENVGQKLRPSCAPQGGTPVLKKKKRKASPRSGRAASVKIEVVALLLLPFSLRNSLLLFLLLLAS